jgi:hypothetical protein
MEESALWWHRAELTRSQHVRRTRCVLFWCHGIVSGQPRELGLSGVFAAHKSKEEAIEWIKRCPNPHNEESEIEIRQLFELDDFGHSEAVEHHRRLGEQIGKK